MNGTTILAELLTTPEGKTLEFKRDLSSLRPILKSLVAFANTAGGTLVIGRAMEIENPGMLPFGMTLDDLKAGVSRVRNRVIARVLREVGVLEEWPDQVLCLRRRG